MQQVVEPAVGQGPAQHVEGSQLTRLLDPQPTGQQQLQQTPVPKRGSLGGDQARVVGTLAQLVLGVVPATQREGTDVGNLALQVQHSRGQPGLGTRRRALAKPVSARSWRVSTTLDGAWPANGESGSVAQVEMSAKNTRKSTSQVCGVVRSSVPLRG